jgi:hypothetical protein
MQLRAHGALREATAKPADADERPVAPPSETRIIERYRHPRFGWAIAAKVERQLETLGHDRHNPALPPADVNRAADGAG